MNHPQARLAGIVGPYRSRNFGDDLIGLVMARHLGRIGFGEVWMHQIAESNALMAGAVVRTPGEIIRRADLVVIGGGHILGDGSHVPGVYYQRLAFLTALIRRMLGRRTVICGVGAGPLALRRARLYVRMACRLVERIGVRDSESVRYLTRELGCPQSKLIEGADLALLWPEMLGLGLGDGKERCEVGVQMDWRREMQPAGFTLPEAVVDKCAGCVRYLSNGRKATRAKSLLGIAGAETSYCAMPDFLNALLRCRVVVTTHLHLAIAAYAARIPSFTLAVNSKTRRFYEQIGHPERCFELAQGGDATSRVVAGVLQRALDGVEWSAEDEMRWMELAGRARRLLAGIGE